MAYFRAFCKASIIREALRKVVVCAYKLDTDFVDIVFQKQRLRISINMKFSEVSDPKGSQYIIQKTRKIV